MNYDLIERAEDLAALCIPPASGLVHELIEEITRLRARLALADAVAYEAARSDIECMAVREKCGSTPHAGHWYMVEGLRQDEGQQEAVNRAIAYLASRGLIERDEAGLVCVLDEPRA